MGTGTNAGNLERRDRKISWDYSGQSAILCSGFIETYLLCLLVADTLDTSICPATGTYRLCSP